MVHLFFYAASFLIANKYSDLFKILKDLQALNLGLEPILLHF